MIWPLRNELWPTIPTQCCMACGSAPRRPIDWAATWHQQQLEIEAVVDTGFNGFLTLSHEDILTLDLASAGKRRATLANGAAIALDVYLAQVKWDETAR